ncbi:MAG: hypothetical protein K0R66_750 [Gammaproteobacteria bacterium]|jgi:hypothetical protein|nr:hypothetical protein [Gammaproteobacteria bacterium]
MDELTYEDLLSALDALSKGRRLVLLNAIFPDTPEAGARLQAIAPEDEDLSKLLKKFPKNERANLLARIIGERGFSDIVSGIDDFLKVLKSLPEKERFVFVDEMNDLQEFIENNLDNNEDFEENATNLEEIIGDLLAILPESSHIAVLDQIGLKYIRENISKDIFYAAIREAGLEHHTIRSLSDHVYNQVQLQAQQAIAFSHLPFMPIGAHILPPVLPKKDIGPGLP